MKLLPIFGFKGYILPVLDRYDKLYLYVENKSGDRVLLNFVSVETNKFVSLDDNEKKFVFVGEYNNIQLKVFYMGQELFDFHTGSISKETLLLFSDYMFENNNTISDVSFDIVVSDCIKINSISKTLQSLFVKITDIKTNEIVREELFMSNDIYTFQPKTMSSYNISIFNSMGKNVYQQNT